MCSQNAGNVISEPPILRISPGPPLESLSMSPPDKTKTLRLCLSWHAYSTVFRT